MDILYHFRTRGTGPEGVHISGVANALERLGHHVVFSSPTGVDPRRSAGANPFATRGKNGRWQAMARRAPGLCFELMEVGYNAISLRRNWGLLRRSKVDLLYERHAFFCCSSALLAKRFGVPLVVEVNELVGDERVREEPTLRPLAELSDRVLFRCADLIVTVSPHLRRRLVERGVDARKILVQPNAVDADEVRTPGDGATVRDRYGIRNATVIGFVGWFVAWHRLDWLIEAFAAVRKERRDAKLMLVGTGPLQSQLESQAARLGVGRDVVFTGAVDRDEVYDHVAAFDVAVIPFSNSYRSPIKLFEYMAQGRAVVAPSTEPVEMVLRDGENGVLFDPVGPAQLEAAIRRVVQAPGMRRELGRRARTTVLQRHTWVHNATQVLAQMGVDRDAVREVSTPTRRLHAA